MNEKIVFSFFRYHVIDLFILIFDSLMSSIYSDMNVVCLFVAKTEHVYYIIFLLYKDRITVSNL